MEKRFEFGKNWEKFSNTLTRPQIEIAKNSLTSIFGEEGFKGKSFLDIGCGSGIFTLAAVELGAAHVFAFDYDSKCVETARKNLAQSKVSRDSKIVQGDILDSKFLETLEDFDIVYSWGVLHHTGDMWKALSGAISLVKPGGFLMIAIYNSQGWESLMWRRIKRTYVFLPRFLKYFILVPCFIRLWAPTFIKDLFNLDPFKSWGSYLKRRGMSPWTDVIDWVGGYPFEVATPSEVNDFIASENFVLVQSRLVGRGLGCNEFLFRRKSK